MATLTVTEIAEAGTQISEVAVSASDEMPNDGSTLLVVTNGNASACTVTATAQKTGARVPGMGQTTKGDAEGVIPAGQQWVFGPFPETAFSNSNGRVELAYSVTPSVTARALKVVRRDG